MGLMIVSKNVIHGAYSLAIVLLSMAGLFVLLNAEYLAVVQIFMYAGGVVVLLVFGIMLTNRSRKGPPLTNNRNVILSLIFVVVLTSIISVVTWQSGLSWEVIAEVDNQTESIGRLFLTDYLLAFELIAILLLGVLVGTAFLAKKSTTL